MIQDLTKVTKPERYRGVNIYHDIDGFRVFRNFVYPTMYLAKKKVDLTYLNFKVVANPIR